MVASLYNNNNNSVMDFESCEDQGYAGRSLLARQMLLCRNNKAYLKGSSEWLPMRVGAAQRVAVVVLTLCCYSSMSR